MGRWIDGQIDRQIKRQIDRYIDRQIDIQIDKKIERQIGKKIKLYPQAILIFFSSGKIHAKKETKELKNITFGRNYKQVVVIQRKLENYVIGRRL